MSGRIEVVCGPMWGGKSEELVRRLTRARIGKRNTVAFKHASDNRYHETDIGCHGGMRFKAQASDSVAHMTMFTSDAEVIGIDEAQFFGEDLIRFVEDYANSGCRMIVAGLDLDAEGRPFGPMPGLMAIADEVLKLTAVCVICGEPATRSFHLAGKVTQVEVGVDTYEARCRGCWTTGRSRLALP